MHISCIYITNHEKKNGGRCEWSGRIEVYKYGDLSILGQKSTSESIDDGNLTPPYTISQSVNEYLPQNSQMVGILTEIGTPCRSNVNIGDSFVDSQNSECSQDTYTGYIPNQDFIAMLDRELDELAKEPFIVKLIELTNESEDTITWYRSVLASRARSLQGCPLGKLVTRKSTHKTSSLQKYALVTVIYYIYLLMVIHPPLRKSFERTILNRSVIRQEHRTVRLSSCVLLSRM